MTRTENATQWEVSHPCDGCRVEVSFFITKTGNKTVFCFVQEDGSIYYEKTVRCTECGLVDTHSGEYNTEWM